LSLLSGTTKRIFIVVNLSRYIDNQLFIKAPDDAIYKAKGINQYCIYENVEQPSPD
jgi:hypothetical protein